MSKSFTHVIGLDDAPFDPDYRGDVLVVGAIYAGQRLDGVLSGKVRRDGVNATAVLIRMLRASRFIPQIHLVLLQGIAEKAGPMEPIGGLFIQRAGITLDRAALALQGLAIHSSMPEPLRTAHLIAGGVTRGESRHPV